MLVSKKKPTSKRVLGNKRGEEKRKRERQPKGRNEPDFLDEDGTELASEVLGADAVLEVLAGEDSLLGVLDVASGLASDESLDAARDHYPSHHCEGLLQIPVPNPNPNPSKPLHLMLLLLDRHRAAAAAPAEEGRRLP